MLNISHVMKVDDTGEFANLLILINSEKDILRFIHCLDVSYAEMDFSEKLLTQLVNSIAMEGADACDMEAIVANARKKALK